MMNAPRGAHHGLCGLGGEAIRGELWGRQPSPFAAVLKMGVCPDLSMCLPVEYQATKARVKDSVSAFH